MAQHKIKFSSVRAKLTHQFNITASIFFKVFKELFETDVNAAKKKDIFTGFLWV